MRDAIPPGPAETTRADVATKREGREAGAAPSIATRASQVLAWILVLAVVVQFYSAGLGVFGAASFRAHAVIGTLAPLVGLALLIAVLVARRGSKLGWSALACLALLILQPVLVFVVRPQAPVIAALHPVVGLLIGWLALQIARR